MPQLSRIEPAKSTACSAAGRRNLARIDDLRPPGTDAVEPSDSPEFAWSADAHPGMCFDLMGSTGMYWNSSRDPEGWRDFFLRCQDRPVSGTDCADEPSPDGGKAQRIIGLSSAPLDKILRGNSVRLAGGEAPALDLGRFSAGGG